MGHRSGRATRAGACCGGCAPFRGSPGVLPSPSSLVPCHFTPAICSSHGGRYDAVGDHPPRIILRYAPPCCLPRGRLPSAITVTFVIGKPPWPLSSLRSVSRSNVSFLFRWPLARCRPCLHLARGLQMASDRTFIESVQCGAVPGITLLSSYPPHNPRSCRVFPFSPSFIFTPSVSRLFLSFFSFATRHPNRIITPNSRLGDCSRIHPSNLAHPGVTPDDSRRRGIVDRSRRHDEIEREGLPLHRRA